MWRWSRHSARWTGLVQVMTWVMEMGQLGGNLLQGGVWVLTIQEGTGGTPHWKVELFIKRNWTFLFQDLSRIDWLDTTWLSTLTKITMAIGWKRSSTIFPRPKWGQTMPTWQRGGMSHWKVKIFIKWNKTFPFQDFSGIYWLNITWLFTLTKSTIAISWRTRSKS